MGKDIYDMIKPENEKDKKEEVKATNVDKSVLKKIQKEEKKAYKAAYKEAYKKEFKKEKAVKTENKEVNSLFSNLSKDAVIVYGIVAAMIVVCLGIVLYYFFNVTNANMATYNGGKVTRKEYEIQYKLMASEMQYQGKSADDIRSDIVDNIVVNKLLIEEFNKAKMSLSEESKKLISDFEKDDESIATYTSRGVTKEDLVNLYSDIVTAKQYSDKIQTESSDATIKEAIIAKEGKDANMNKYITRHILFAFTDSESGEAKDKAAQKTKAEEILAKAKNGEDFAALATANSEDTGSKEDGGKVEMVPDKEMGAPEYIDAMVTLKAGEIYGSVVETEFGYHVIKLDSIVEGGRITDENVKASYSYMIAKNMLEKSNVKLKVKSIERVEKELVKYVGVGNANQ